MVSEGGLKEALDLFEKIKEHNFEKGLLQSIGYKEFYPVYQINSRVQALEYVSSGSPFDQSEIVDKCISNLEVKTMQYA